MSDYSLVEPFEIDDGELDGLTPQQCFTLGVEWEMFREKMKSESPFRSLLNDDNAKRIANLVDRHKRFNEVHHVCDGWAEIIVGDELPNGS